MIPFRTWISQIVGYCHFVVDDRGVRSAWVNGDYSQTSITSFNEFYEQIFDDLDSDALEKELHTFLPDDSESRELLSAFLQQIRDIDARREQGHGLGSTEELLNSAEWGRLVAVARCVESRVSYAGISEAED